ncbi:MAG: reverse transcriptase domain-containing protein [Planctomycetota bacterium]|nr:reverse transcriptase domain-containing protein [Planctomycetota bacterium]
MKALAEPVARRSRQCYEVSNAEDFNLTKFAKVDNLHSAYRRLEADGGAGAGIDGLSYDDYSPGEAFAALRQVSESIRDQTYKPWPTRSVRVPKVSNADPNNDRHWRTLELLRVPDRDVSKALQVALDRFWRSRVPTIGRDVWEIFAEMQRAIRERQTYVLAIDDIRNCFPNARIADVMTCHREFISQPDLLWLIDTVIRGHDGHDHLSGLYQGSPYSPIAVEALLHHRLDARLEATHQGLPLLLRYVDNLNFLCRSESEGHQVLQVAEEHLDELDFTLKHEDLPPMDIRDNGFNQPILGFIPGWSNGQLTFSIPETAYGDLREAVQLALMAPMSSRTAHQTVNGWLESHGPALTRTEVPEVVERVKEVTKRCGFTELRTRPMEDVARKARRRWIGFAER